MTRFFASIMMVFAVMCVGAATASRHLRPSTNQASTPCTMHSQSSSSDNVNAGSFNESGTISIGNKIFNIVDKGDTMTIGDTEFKVFS
ncbi:hypothetical protein GN244_ATG05184 [Phytophthora infestans]|uniref:Secreted RxLR effector peptide protein n=1 Tax=Phytophthora infestans TaxID=4787 RepID=A0A833TKT4_PHYIN|nr:hypothetical protein GN244_ATG05184 [Phytophthora infestans]KAF4150559.1 hypothetical protein GN958_ATG00221 [Phytophthora infestans]